MVDIVHKIVLVPFADAAAELEEPVGAAAELEEPVGPAAELEEPIGPAAELEEPVGPAEETTPRRMRTMQILETKIQSKKRRQAPGRD